MNRKMIKVILIVIIVLVILFFGIGIFIGNYFYDLALNPNSDKSSVFEAPHNVIFNEDEPNLWEIQREDNERWLETITHEDVYMQSYDELNLHSQVLKNEEDSHLWAVVCHGYGGEGMGMLTSSRKFYDMGFHILLPDARGHGTSEGNYIGMGWDERKDITDWIDEIIEMDSDAQIIVYGVSMGGATVMMVSGEELPGNVKAIVEDCGYSSIWGEFEYQLKELFGMPTFPVMNFASLVTKRRAGFWLGDGDAIKQVSQSVTPMLFIHGDEDTFVSFSMLQQVYDAANCEKEMIAVEGAGHGMSADILGDEYWDKVQEFIFRYLDE